jgi:hypothetical protein
MRQRKAASPDLGLIHWEIERGVAIVSRLAKPDGRLLAEILPEERGEGRREDRNEGRGEGRGNDPPPADGRDYLHYEKSFEASDLEGMVGLGFDWVFEIPVPPEGKLQPSHALGVVRVNGSELLGKETTLTINAGGRETNARS